MYACLSPKIEAITKYRNIIICDLTKAIEVTRLNFLISYVKIKNTRKHKIIVKELFDVQEKLFTLSAQIAGSNKVEIYPKDIDHLERRGKSIQQSLSENWHSKFIYPGGSRAAAWADIARSVCRRVERGIVSYSKENEVSPLILQYINRLSDYIYLVRCQLNDLDNVNETEFN